MVDSLLFLKYGVFAIIPLKLFQIGRLNALYYFFFEFFLNDRFFSNKNRIGRAEIFKKKCSLQFIALSFSF